MDKKIIAILLLFTTCGLLTFSQVTETEKALRTKNPADTTLGWKTGGVISISLAQTSLTNWVSGGQNSVSINGLFSGFANYKKGKSVWDNSLDLGYGLLKQGKNEAFRKTDDKIEISSKYGREAFKNFYYSAFMNFRTQMTPGYNYPNDSTKISDLFSPAYLILALGLDYKPNAYFSAFFAPITGRFTFVSDPVLADAGSFGVKPGEKSRSEIGSYLRVAYSKNDFKSEILKNVSLTTKIDFFSNYVDQPQNIDVNWDVLLTLKVNKYLAVNFNTQLVYDDNIKVPFDTNGNGTIETGEGVMSRIQFKEILGVGLSYKF